MSFPTFQPELSQAFSTLWFIFEIGNPVLLYFFLSQEECRLTLGWEHIRVYIYIYISITVIFVYSFYYLVACSLWLSCMLLRFICLTNNTLGYIRDALVKSAPLALEPAQGHCTHPTTRPPNHNYNIIHPFIKIITWLVSFLFYLKLIHQIITCSTSSGSMVRSNACWALWPILVCGSFLIRPT